MLVVNAAGETERAKELWFVPLSGAAGTLDLDVRGGKPGEGIRLHSDGRHIAFFTGEGAREVWALESVVPTSSKR